MAFIHALWFNYIEAEQTDAIRLELKAEVARESISREVIERAEERLFWSLSYSFSENVDE